MSVKNKDPKGHWRSKNVCFRVSPEEAKELDMLVELSGMFKQDYILSRLLNKEIVLYPNIRIQRVIINRLDELVAELKRLEQIDQSSDVLEKLIYLLELTEKLTRK